MNAKCTECGTIIQTGDNDQERIQTLMAKHALLHATPEARHASTLTKCLAAFRLIETGGKFTKFDARDLSAEVSSLLGVPFAPGEKENVPLATALPVGAGTNGADSHVPEPAKDIPADHDGNVSSVQPSDAV